MKYDFSFVSIRIKGYDIFYAEKVRSSRFHKLFSGPCVKI